MARSGCEPLTEPGVPAVEPVADAIVQAIGSPLPEFELDGQEAIATPQARTLDVSLLRARIEIGQRLLEVLTTGDDRALTGHRGTQLAQARTAPLVLPRLVKKTNPRSSSPLSSTTRASGQPPLSTVLSVMAFG